MPGVTGTINARFRTTTKTAGISGVIGTSSSYVKQQIDRVRDQKNIKAVVLRVNSPGGTITGSDYIYHHLLKLKEKRKIRLVVSS